MQCEGIGKQEAQFQERRYERQDLVDGLGICSCLGLRCVRGGPLSSIANRALCGLLRAPPSPAMRWPSVLGNLGDGEACGAAAGSSLTGSRSKTRTRGSYRKTVGSQTTTRDPGRRVDSCGEPSSRQYERRAIDVPSSIIIDDAICAAVDGRWRRELRRRGRKERRDRDGSGSRQTDLTLSRFLLLLAPPALCDLQLPLKSSSSADGLASPSSTWQAPPTSLEPINGSDKCK